MTSGTHGSDPGQPAEAVTNAQLEFDADPELRDLLAYATASPTVRRATERGPAPRPTVPMTDGPDAGTLVQQMRAEERY